jgi:hypothetical protein
MGVRGVLIYCADYRCSHSVFAIERGWLELQESGTYVRLLKTEAAN